MKRRIVANTSYFALSNTLQFALAFFTSVLIGRVLGAEALGIYGLASAIGQVALRISELGMPTIVTRMLARGEPEARRRWAAALVFRLWSGVAMVVAVELFALVIDYSLEIQIVLALYSSSQVAAGLRDIASCAYLASERMGRIAFAAAAFRIVAFTFTIALLLLGLGVAWAIAALFVGQVVSFLIVVRGPLDVPPLLAPFDWPALREIIRESYPLALAGVLAMIGFRVDAMILSTFVTSAELGIYSAAFSVIVGFSLFPSSVLPAVFPVLARKFRSDEKAATRLYLRLQLLSLIVGLSCAVIVYLLADVAMSMLYGAEFSAAASPLRILCWSIPFTFVAYTNLSFFNATNRQANNLSVTALYAATNAVANLALIPDYGAVGAAWAAVTSASVQLVATYVVAAARHSRTHSISP